MKRYILGLMMFSSVTMFSQGDIDLKNEKPLTQHELGLTFTYTPDLSRYRFSGIQLALPSVQPNLSYQYYMNESRVLHFAGNFAINGRFYQSFGASFWNERRKYINDERKWYFSHGLNFSAAITHFNYGGVRPGDPRFLYSTVSTGYSIGGGYRINDHFTLNARVTPQLGYLIPINGHAPDWINKKWSFSAPFQFGINYRF